MSKIKTAFVFPGYGCQWKGMGAGLWEYDRFREAIRDCEARFSMNAGVDIRIEAEIRKPAGSSRLEETLVGYPCSLALEIALWELLKSWGIVPDGVIGHSGGETIAAYAAGILNLHDTFKVIWNHWVEMKKSAGNGLMAHINLPGEKVREILHDEKLDRQVFISAQNSPSATIVSGWRPAVEGLVALLSGRRIFCRGLETLAPFHSPLMEHYRDTIYRRLEDIEPVKPSIPIYSSLKGGLSVEAGGDPLYWTDHMIKPVNFTGAVRAMLRDGYSVFVEVSPHAVLVRNIKEIFEAEGRENITVMGLQKKDGDEKAELFNALAQLSRAGVGADAEARPFKGFQDEGRGEPCVHPGYIIHMIETSLREASDGKIDLAGEIDAQRGFFDMGVDSVIAVKLVESLSRRMGLTIPTAAIFNYPDMESLSGYLMSVSVANEKGTGPAARGAYKGILEKSPPEPVAIIGMACRFPGGANSPEAFWELLKNGKDTVTGIPKERWDGDAFFAEEMTPGKSITRFGHFLSGVDIAGFDAAFFRISPKEARALDPQQRLLLEVTVEALERAGIPLSGVRGQEVGVFVGICQDDYKSAHLHSADLGVIDAYSASGSMFSPAAGRVSYFLGTRGPSVAFDTACSSALTALHYAVQSLRSGECHMALAGGVNCLLSPNMFVYLTQLQSLAPDGVCKTFDEKADGFGRGEGCGVVVLKRLSDAQRDRDNILAVILGSAVNHDGASAGFTVPNGIAQVEVIAKALANAGVSAGSVDYVEAHGAGTPLGDPIEIEAIRGVYGIAHTLDDPVKVGTVKTNIGHLEGAAGAAGLIKAILALRNQAIPAHLHVTKPNPAIAWGRIPVKINTELTLWEVGGKPRRVGISGFGFSGTNAHVIIEEAPIKSFCGGRGAVFSKRAPLVAEGSKKAKGKGTGKEYRLSERDLNCQLSIANCQLPTSEGTGKEYIPLFISAKSEEALIELVRAYERYLSREDLPAWGDIGYTAAVGRCHYSYRFSGVGECAADLHKKIRKFLADPGKSSYSNIPVRRWNKSGGGKKIVFLFPGQGSHYPGMGKELYEAFPVFREEMERCDRLFSSYIGESVLRLLYSAELVGGWEEMAGYAQPVIFSVEYALSKLWLSWGVMPSLVMGHSIGEYAAACFAGILTLEDAVKLVALRGKLMQSVVEPGLMVGILASEDKARALIGVEPGVSIAAVNGPANVTISGRIDSVLKVIERVKQEKVFVEPLVISHAFHSVVMEPYVEGFGKEIGGMVFSRPRQPVVSTILGRLVEEEMSEPGYWASHICRGVRFYDSMKLVWGQGFRVFIEMGGTAVLAGLAGQCIPVEEQGVEGVFLPSLRKGRDGCEQVFTSLSRLYIHGLELDWEGVYRSWGVERNKVLLPTYPFQRERYWAPGGGTLRRHFVPSPGALIGAPRIPIISPGVTDKGTGEENKENNKSFCGGGRGAPRRGEPISDLSKRAPLISELVEMIHTVSGLELGESDHDADLFALGLDSLMLVELRRKIMGQYGVDISLNEFFLELTTLNKIARYIRRVLPVEEGSTGYYPMSSAQKRLYVLTQMGDGERAYHVPMVMRVKGPLQVEKVEAVFRELIKRHEVLRTGLEVKDGQMVQRVYGERDVEFSVIYKTITESEADTRGIGGLMEEVLRPFDASKPPLMRVCIAGISSTHFIFITDFHHCIMMGRRCLF